MKHTYMVLLLILVINLGAWFWLRLDQARDTGGGDVIGGLFAHKRVNADDYVYFWFGWTVICFVVIAGLGSMGKEGFLTHPFQLVNAFNYAFVVPVLAATYLLLLRSVSKFIRSPISEFEQRMYLKWKAIRQFGIIIATEGIVYSAMISEVSAPSPQSPWVSCNGAACTDISPYGIAFFVMRGLDASMALGIVSSISLIFFHRRQRFFGRKLVDNEFPGLGPTRHVMNLGTSLLLVGTLSSLVVGLHGAALFLQARDAMSVAASPDKKAREITNLFFTSSWSIWVVLALLTSVLCVVIVLWIRDRITHELADHQRREEKIVVAYSPCLQVSTNEQLKALFDLEKVRLEIDQKMSDKYDKAQTWPLPKHAGIAVAGAAISQLANLVFAVLTVLLAK